MGCVNCHMFLILCFFVEFVSPCFEEQRQRTFEIRLSLLVPSGSLPFSGKATRSGAGSRAASQDQLKCHLQSSTCKNPVCWRSCRDVVVFSVMWFTWLFRCMSLTASKVNWPGRSCPSDLLIITPADFTSSSRSCLKQRYSLLGFTVLKSLLINFELGHVASRKVGPVMLSPVEVDDV